MHSSVLLVLNLELSCFQMSHSVPTTNRLSSSLPNALESRYLSACGHRAYTSHKHVFVYLSDSVGMFIMNASVLGTTH